MGLLNAQKGAESDLTYHEQFGEQTEVEVRELLSIKHRQGQFLPQTILTRGPSFPGAPSAPAVPGSPCQTKASVSRLEVSSLGTCPKRSHLQGLLGKCQVFWLQQNFTYCKRIALIWKIDCFPAAIFPFYPPSLFCSIINKR